MSIDIGDAIVIQIKNLFLMAKNRIHFTKQAGRIIYLIPIDTRG